ncbi:MAG: DUF4198 domain-containing protein [Symploca sp. SIO2B6]|nr:DUF4198 domain-containing protein [Symploca sp. SIO2B6]
MKGKQLIFTLSLLLALVAYPIKASAHSLETDYQLKSNALEIQATFSNGEPFPDAAIVVFSPDDPTHPWLEARTDENGKFIFNPEQALAGDWSIEIGEDSHWDNIIVPVSDRGISLEEISYLDKHDSDHHYHLTNQFIVLGIALGGGLSSRFLSRKLTK